MLTHTELTFPARERRIHGGRKRIDIVYINGAADGFFDWLTRHFPATHFVIDCKNYAGDPANPELDQLAGAVLCQQGDGSAFWSAGHSPTRSCFGNDAAIPPKMTAAGSSQ